MSVAHGKKFQNLIDVGPLIKKKSTKLINVGPTFIPESKVYFSYPICLQKKVLWSPEISYLPPLNAYLESRYIVVVGAITDIYYNSIWLSHFNLFYNYTSSGFFSFPKKYRDIFFEIFCKFY